MGRSTRNVTGSLLLSCLPDYDTSVAAASVSRGIPDRHSMHKVTHTRTCCAHMVCALSASPSRDGIVPPGAATMSQPRVSPWQIGDNPPPDIVIAATFTGMGQWAYGSFVTVWGNACFQQARIPSRVLQSTHELPSSSYGVFLSSPVAQRFQGFDLSNMLPTQSTTSSP